MIYRFFFFKKGLFQLFLFIYFNRGKINYNYYYRSQMQQHQHSCWSIKLKLKTNQNKTLSKIQMSHHIVLRSLTIVFITNIILFLSVQYTCNKCFDTWILADFLIARKCHRSPINTAAANSYFASGRLLCTTAACVCVSDLQTAQGLLC